MSEHDEEQIRKDVEEMRRVLMDSVYEGPMCFLGPFEVDPEKLGQHTVEVTVNGKRIEGTVFACRCGAVTVAEDPRECWVCGWRGDE